VEDVSVLILAGQRAGVVDPLCSEAGIERKAVIPLNGRPMLDYVLAALQNTPLKTPYFISGYPATHSHVLVQSPEAPGPAGSALSAFEAGIAFPAIMTTADHPLLTPEMLTHFISQARKSGADFCVGLAEKTIIQPAYPDVKRTYLKFSDRSVSGCNLFYFANADSLAAIRFWERAQKDRKRPMKLASHFGIRILFDYILGRLTLDSAFNYASKRMGVLAKPILIPIAEAAIDVDKPSDKVLVERILKERAQSEPKPIESA